MEILKSKMSKSYLLFTEIDALTTNLKLHIGTNIPLYMNFKDLPSTSNYGKTLKSKDSINGDQLNI